MESSPDKLKLELQRTTKLAAIHLLASLLCMALLAGSALRLSAATLTVAMVEGPTNQTLSVPISVSNAAPSAAAFTVTFDTASLAVEAESAFFGSFVEQYAASGAFTPRATSADVGGRTHTNAFLTTPLAGKGLAIAGLRRLPPAGSNETLLTLKVSLRPGAAAGLYDINLEPSRVNLAAAGYDPAGQPLPLLLGRDRLNDAYPVLLAADGSAMHVVPGYVKFNPADPDTDDDGLPDWWEQQHFGNLATASANTDGDGDGLIAIVEFFLGSDPTRAETGFVIRGERVGSDFKMYFPMRTGHGLSVEIAWSTDLSTWSPTGITLSPRPDLGSGADWTMMEASVPTNGAAAMFLRLNIRPGTP